MTSKSILVLVLVAWVILAVFALAGAVFPLPPEWLQAWTKWIATVVGIVVSARVLWSGAALLQKYAR